MSQRPLTISEKLEIINYYEKERPELEVLANRFNVGKIQAANIVNNREYIRNNVDKLQDDSKTPRKKTFFNPQGKIIDTATYEWYLNQIKENRPVSGKLLKEKAMKIARSIKHHQFMASNGWLQKWRLRHNVNFQPASRADSMRHLSSSTAHEEHHHQHHHHRPKANGTVANTNSHHMLNAEPVRRDAIKSKLPKKPTNDYESGGDFDPLAFNESSYGNGGSDKQETDDDEILFVNEYESIFKVDSYSSALNAIQDLKNFAQDDDIALEYLNKIERHFQIEASK